MPWKTIEALTADDWIEELNQVQCSFRETPVYCFQIPNLLLGELRCKEDPSITPVDLMPLDMPVKVFQVLWDDRAELWRPNAIAEAFWVSCNTLHGIVSYSIRPDGKKGGVNVSRQVQFWRLDFSQGFDEGIEQVGNIDGEFKVFVDGLARQLSEAHMNALESKFHEFQACEEARQKLEKQMGA